MFGSFDEMPGLVKLVLLDFITSKSDEGLGDAVLIVIKFKTVLKVKLSLSVLSLLLHEVCPQERKIAVLLIPVSQFNKQTDLLTFKKFSGYQPQTSFGHNPFRELED